MDPSSGKRRAARILSKVDLPQPFGPTKPIFSPSSTLNDVPEKRACSARVFETESRESIAMLLYIRKELCLSVIAC